MKQYCRYCAFCFEGDGYFCGHKSKYLSIDKIKRENKCKEFALAPEGDIITGKHYHPQERQDKLDQIKIGDK